LTTGLSLASLICFDEGDMPTCRHADMPYLLGFKANAGWVEVFLVFVEENFLLVILCEIVSPWIKSPGVNHEVVLDFLLVS